MRKSIFIICGGNSLKNQDINFLAMEDTIAVNSTINNLPFEPTYFLTADSGIIKTAAENNFWNKKNTHTVCVINPNEHPRWDKVKDYPKLFNEWIIPNKWNGEISINAQKDEFATGKNSGFCALQYAVKLGYKNIYLLGVDLQKSEGQKYYYGDGNNSPYDVFYEHFKTGLKILKDSYINIYSCSPISLLNKHIEYIPIEDLVLNMPIFVSHYTINTPYESIVLKLKESLDKFKLDYELEGINTLGSWRFNSNYCAVQVQKALRKYSPRPILRLDADAVVQRLPDLLIKSKSQRPDIAGCIWDKSKLVPTGEFMGGTIYFGNTEKSKILADKWVELCKQKPNHRNGDLLYSIIQSEKKNIRFEKLPLSYCKIYDYNNMTPEPAVIEHFQASRKNKRFINTMGLK
jgi:hypothetical protein